MRRYPSCLFGVLDEIRSIEAENSTERLGTDDRKERQLERFSEMGEIEKIQVTLRNEETIRDVELQQQQSVDLEFLQ